MLSTRVLNLDSCHQTRIPKVRRSWPKSIAILIMKASTAASSTTESALLGQGPARAVPAPTVGEVKHTVALTTLWASPSGRGWFLGWIGYVRACRQDGQFDSFNAYLA